MKFLLVTSLKKELVKVWVCQETSPAGSLLPPVDLASIASIIRNKSHEARILDLRLFKKPLEKYLEELNKYKPDFIVLNLSTTSANYDYKLISSTPDNIKTICFGTHAQSLPEESFKKGVDYILSGDPEAAIANLMENNMDGSISDGVLTREVSEKKRVYWENLDSMPFPALDLLDMHKYYAPYIKRGNIFTLLLGSRGCPHLCTYCLYPVLFGDKFRLRSVENIVNEMQVCNTKFGISEFYFLDATFNANPKRIGLFCNELLRRNLKVNWSCNMRVAPVLKEDFNIMKKAGCNRIFYGVEDQDFLQETQKGISKKQTLDAFRLTKEAGILTVAFTMLFPDRNISGYKENILNTLSTLEADAFQCNIAIPFPGTQMFDKLENKLSHDWSLYDPHTQKLPYDCNGDLIKIRKEIYTKFLLRNPGTILKIAADINFKALIMLIITFIKQNLVPTRFSGIKKVL